jgi:hypothetical protein
VSPEQEPAATLMNSLLAVQAEAPKLAKDATNPHFKSKFVSLGSLVETIAPLLSKHGLVWVTMPTRVEGEPMLGYRLVHAATGEAIEGAMPLMLKTVDPQAQGSALTYARRYSLMAVLNLVTDEDDDGNRAQSASRRPQEPPYGPAAPPDVAASARRAIAWMLGEAPVNGDEVTVLLREIEATAKGYLPEIAALAVGHVAAAARAKTQAPVEEIVTPRVDNNAAADEAARAAEQMRGTI